MSCRFPSPPLSSPFLPPLSLSFLSGLLVSSVLPRLSFLSLSLSLPLAPLLFLPPSLLLLFRFVCSLTSFLSSLLLSLPLCLQTNHHHRTSLFLLVVFPFWLLSLSLSSSASKLTQQHPLNVFYSACSDINQPVSYVVLSLSPTHPHTLSVRPRLC